MKGQDQARLMEINMLSEAIKHAESITFDDSTIKDAFLVRAKDKLERLLAQFSGQ